MLNEVGGLHRPELNFLEHDLMIFVDIPDQDSTRHIFVGPEVESLVDVGSVGFEGVDSVVMGVVSTAEVVEGPADSIHNVLGKFLCEHEKVRGT